MDAITPPSIKERPIIFSSAMVRAILEGRKTQTRRIAKIPEYAKGSMAPQELRGEPMKHSAPYFDAYCGQRLTPQNPRGMSGYWCWWDEYDRQGNGWVKCPYGQPGDRLWVRESFRLFPIDVTTMEGPERFIDDAGIEFRADYSEIPSGSGWKPPIHMPRWGSRILLEVVSVRVERVQDISESDARAEGIEGTEFYSEIECDSICWSLLWESINGKGNWNSNPWVWVVEFKRVDAHA